MKVRKLIKETTEIEIKDQSKKKKRSKPMQIRIHQTYSQQYYMVVEL